MAHAVSVDTAPSIASPIFQCTQAEVWPVVWAHNAALVNTLLTNAFGRCNISPPLDSIGARLGDDEAAPALMLASQFGNPVTTKLLLDAGAALGAGDRRGLTAVHVAAARGYDVTLVALLSAAASNADAGAPTPAAVGVSNSNSGVDDDNGELDRWFVALGVGPDHSLHLKSAGYTRIADFEGVSVEELLEAGVKPPVARKVSKAGGSGSTTDDGGRSHGFVGSGSENELHAVLYERTDQYDRLASDLALSQAAKCLFARLNTACPNASNKVGAQCSRVCLISLGGVRQLILDPTPALACAASRRYNNLPLGHR
jgi:hypothetical protein